jgi:hypothetical protein
MPNRSWLLNAAAFILIVGVIALVTVENDALEGAALAAFAVAGAVATRTMQRWRKPPD